MTVLIGYAKMKSLWTAGEELMNITIFRSNLDYMELKKVFIRNDNKATVVCDRCGEVLLLECPQFNGNSTIMRVNCKCSAEFDVLFEKRCFYRKAVELFGGVSRIDDDRSTADRMIEVTVQDLSRTGISFQTSTNHNFKQGDYLRISFILNDSQRSRVSLNLVVKRILDRNIGAEITTAEIPKSLAFYLLP